MSSRLKSINLAGAVIGTTGSIDFNQFVKFMPSDITQKAHIRILNESGCGLDLAFSASGNSHSLPAGAWATFDLEPNDGNVTVTVTYLLPNPPVSLVLAMYYAPGESVPQAFTLGNSPIGIGGSISVSTIQALINDGSGAGTQIIESTVSGDSTSTTTLTNDGKLKLGDIAHPGQITIGGSGPTTPDPIFSNDGFGDLTVTTQFGLAMQVLAGGSTQFYGGVNPELTGVSVAGTTGTATLYEIMQGDSGKLFLLFLVGYTSGVTNTLTLPTAFVRGCQFSIGTIAGTGSYSFIHSSAAVTCDCLTALSITGGSVSQATVLKQMTQGATRGGFESIQLAPFGSATIASLWGIGL